MAPDSITIPESSAVGTVVGVSILILILPRPQDNPSPPPGVTSDDPPGLRPGLLRLVQQEDAEQVQVTLAWESLDSGSEGLN